MGPTQFPIYLSKNKNGHRKTSIFFVIMVWVNLSSASKAFGCTALISILPTVTLFAVPFSKGRQPIPPSIHKALLGFASGGLLGDVFLHSIPHLLMESGHVHSSHQHLDHDHPAPSRITDAVHDHAQDEGNDHHDHDHHDHGHEDSGSSEMSVEDKTHAEHHHDHHDGGSEGHNHEDPHAKGLAVGLNILAGFGVFFLFEKIIRAINGGDAHSHHHSHSHAEDAAAKKKVPKAGVGGGGGSIGGTLAGGLLPAGFGAGGWLNLAADSLHNFTDGVAIGAAFAVASSGGGGGEGLGLATFLSVLAHELPHEVGDFAILVQQGCSAKQAIALQFATALFALGGTGMGLYLSEGYQGANEALLGLVSGGFVYLATMTVMPELLKEEENGSAGGRRGLSAVAVQTLIECLAFGAGVFMMVLVAKLEVHDH
jgi:zinc transporter 7